MIFDVFFFPKIYRPAKQGDSRDTKRSTLIYDGLIILARQDLHTEFVKAACAAGIRFDQYPAVANVSFLTDILVKEYFAPRLIRWMTTSISGIAPKELVRDPSFNVDLVRVFLSGMSREYLIGYRYQGSHRNLLQEAVHGGCALLVQLLLELRIFDVNCIDERTGASLISLAILSQYYRQLDNKEPGKMTAGASGSAAMDRTLTMLFEHGCVMASKSIEMSPIHIAVRMQNLHLLNFLLGPPSASSKLDKKPHPDLDIASFSVPGAITEPASTSSSSASAKSLIMSPVEFATRILPLDSKMSRAILQRLTRFYYPNKSEFPVALLERAIAILGSATAFSGPKQADGHDDDDDEFYGSHSDFKFTKADLAFVDVRTMLFFSQRTLQ
jgi:hypothetical protein